MTEYQLTSRLTGMYYMWIFNSRIQMAKEALMLYLDGEIEENIPEPTQISPSIIKPSEEVFAIEIHM